MIPNNIPDWSLYLTKESGTVVLQHAEPDIATIEHKKCHEIMQVGTYSSLEASYIGGFFRATLKAGKDNNSITVIENLDGLNRLYDDVCVAPFPLREYDEDDDARDAEYAATQGEPIVSDAETLLEFSLKTSNNGHIKHKVAMMYAMQSCAASLLAIERHLRPQEIVMSNDFSSFGMTNEEIKERFYKACEALSVLKQPTGEYNG